MRFVDLVETSRRVSEARGRIEKIHHLAGLLRRLEGEEIDAGVAFLSGELRQGRIGVGWASLRDAFPATAAPEPTLALLEVDDAFTRIAATTGPGSAAERLRLLSGLLSRATREEQDFLVRLVVGELRQGALAGIMGEALARAAEVPAADVRRALMLAGDSRAVARALLAEGPAGLSRFRLELLRPLQPMLAQTAEDVPEALGRLGQAALEWKLDGARVQVHRLDDEVRVWSRRGNEVTPAVPELEETLEALDDVVRAGKARYLGASSMFAWQFARALGIAERRGFRRFVSMQDHYNLVYREEEREMLPLCRAEGIGVLPWSPLARGLLAGTRRRDLGGESRRSKSDTFTHELYREDDFAVVDRVFEVAKRRGAKPAQVALAWLLHQPAVTAPIVGVTREEHLEDALAAVDLSLDPEERAEMEEPYQPHPVRGHE